jgi:AcrR family transcriptional regulator
VAKLSEQARSQRRDAIVAAATRRFAASGFHATSMSEVVAESGVAAGTVYQYFPSKEHLIVAVAERALDDVGGVLADLMGRDPVPTLEDFLQAVTAALPATPDGRLRAHLVLHSWAETSRNVELADLVRRRHEAILTGCRPLLAVWRERGELSTAQDDATHARMLLGVVQAHVVQTAVLGSAAPVTDVARAAAALP